MLRLIAFIALGLTALSQTGCTTATDKLESRLKPGEAVEHVYLAKYEEVEAAIKQAMIKYPQRIDNTEAGIFETDYVKGDARYKPPAIKRDYSSGYRYRIIIRLVRGQAEHKSAVQVSVLKQIELARDFFADPDQLNSDGLEEQVIIYRIEREISIAKSLIKASEKAALQPPHSS